MEYPFEQKLKKIIAACGNDINVENINSDTDLVRDFDFTSISIIQLVVQLETDFDIQIDDEYLLIEKLSPYNSLVEMVKVKLEDVNDN